MGSGLASFYAAMMPLLPAPVIDLDMITAAAYRDGRAAGIIESEAAFTNERAMLIAARSAFTSATVVDSGALRDVFVTLVGSLARTVIAAELSLDPAVMARLVDTALAAIATAGDVVVRVHPDDAPYLDRETIIDPAIGRGAVIVESATFIIADGLDARLAAVIEELL